MAILVYNHKEKSMHNKYNSSQKGMLGYHKEDKTFCCEDSDLECAGFPDGIGQLSNSFVLEIDENKHTKTFIYDFVEKDDEGEIQFWQWKSSDGFKFIVFND